jgi:TonB family protein
VVVDPDGQVKDPQVVKSVGLGLDEEALAAVRQWKFKPGSKDGQPVPVYAQIEITFRLLNGPADSSWMAAASTSGTRSDQARLGQAFYWGKVVTQDYAEALNWFQKAAAQDDARSESYLGMMYSQGQGVAKDSVSAVGWFRKAAEQNDATGQVNLGKAYINGDGLSVDYVQALMWLNLAIKGRLQTAQATSLRDQLLLKMSAAEIAEAEALTQKWQPRKN